MDDNRKLKRKVLVAKILQRCVKLCRDMQRMSDLLDGYLWKHPKKQKGTPLRVVCKKEEQQTLLTEFNDSAWAEHQGIWATIAKLKERYCWPRFYKDVASYVETCKECQIYSNIHHKDELHPTYPLSIHYKWMVDIVVMPLGLWQMRYLV